MSSDRSCDSERESHSCSQVIIAPPMTATAWAGIRDWHEAHGVRRSPPAYTLSCGTTVVAVCIGLALNHIIVLLTRGACAPIHQGKDFVFDCKIGSLQ